MNKQQIFVVFSIVMIILALYTIIDYTEVKGTVEIKAINGRLDDHAWESILFSTSHDNQIVTLVYNEDLKSVFHGEYENLIINESVNDLLCTRYKEMDYIVSIHLDSEDKKNGIHKGESFSYLVKREDFNKVKFGDKIIYRVSLLNDWTISKIF